MQPQVLIGSQYIKDFSLEIPNAPQIFKDIKTQPKINIDVNIEHKEIEPEVYEVVLKTSINADIEDQKFFIIELSYACVANIKVEKDKLNEAIAVAVPYQIFPFVRSSIANAMINSGLAPIMLPPIDFLSLFNQKNKAN